MRSDSHEVFRHRIDEALAHGITAHEDQSLNEHIQSCALCKEYADVNARVITSLSGFSFEVAGTLQAQVYASIRLRAQQLEATQPNRLPVALITVLAVMLTATCSLIELQFGGLIAPVFALQREQMQRGLLAFWVVPSLCLLLLFPLLPLLSKRREKIV